MISLSVIPPTFGTEMAAPYKSSTAIPSEAFERFSQRASVLQIGVLSLAKQILALAKEAGELPQRVDPLKPGGKTSSFKFSLSSDFVEGLGGEERARELLRWAIVEGLELSPLAPPKDADQ